MKQILIATTNTHKTEEIAAILGKEFSVHDLREHRDWPPVEETGATFEHNARLKAVAASLRFDGLVLADDSGLEVDALQGTPGVRSARYAGEHATGADNRARLLAELERVEARGKQRSGRFRCVIALARQGEVLAVFSGAVEGVIVNTEKGSGGFGYDSLFVPNGCCETFAELPAETKNALSHRGRALSRLKEEIQQLI